MKTRKSSLALLDATTLVVAACSSGSRPEGPTPPMVNAAPVISGITGKAENQDTVIGPIEFGVQDRETPANQLTVTASVNGTDLFPADGVVLGGNGTVRSVTLTPFEAATGTATVTLTVTDADGARATQSFAVTVNARAASMADAALTTFAKGESAEATTVNGFTYTQDADENTFASLVAQP